MISKYFTADQRFHPVGQGLFYSMNLNLSSDDDDFNFVYDCGTLSVRQYLEEQIRDFHIYHHVIHLLVVSHFDEDHVNGIADLIRNIKVKTLVLPYVDWKERLAIAMALTDSEKKEYLAILSDPLTFFSSDQFDIDEILIVGGPGGSTSTEQERPVPITPQSIEFNKEINDPFKSTTYGTEADLRDSKSLNFALQPGQYPNKKIKFFPDGLKVVAGIFWEFQFYNQESTDAIKIKRLEKSLTAYMTKKKVTELELFKDDHREEVRKIYRSVYSNLNQTSIVLYHGAIQEHQVVQYSHVFNPESGSWSNTEVLSNERTGTLLSGDLKISSIKPLNKLVSHFSRFLPLVSIFSLPHHGAAANWQFSHPNGLENFELYVSSARINSRHHPSKQVVKDVYINCKGDMCLVNEVEKFELETILKIKFNGFL